MNAPIKDRDILVLGIESSCDETSAAVLQNTRLLSNVIANQKVHHKYGGVVPELASRAHLQNIVPVIHAALEEAGVKKNKIDAVAYTRGPGLAGALLVGTSFAKSLSLAWQKPLLEVNHMQAHILAHFIQDNNNAKQPSFPFICLTVSGGHTQLVMVKDPLTFELLGETIDDAAGEAFDKCAKIFGLDYPGGPAIDNYAKTGNAQRFSFGKPKITGLNYSFSGLKTSVLYFVQNETKKNNRFVEENIHDLCASLQRTIVEVLMEKLMEAVRNTGVKEIALAGGVSANAALRNKLTELGKKHNWKVFIPAFQYCTDNAAMIAAAGYFLYQNGKFSSFDKEPLARWAVTN